jgi:hypothetical protein
MLMARAECPTWKSNCINKSFNRHAYLPEVNRAQYWAPIIVEETRTYTLVSPPACEFSRRPEAGYTYLHLGRKAGSSIRI